MARLDRITEKLVGKAGDHGAEVVEGPRAAVAAILRELPGAEGAELFFIRRAERADDPWSGHVAFPGGRRDAQDASLLATAIRETREEVGIELSVEHLLARLPDIPAFARSKKGNLVVTPFVFALRAEVAVVPNVEVGKSKLRDNELTRIGKKRWNRRVAKVVTKLDAMFHYDRLYIGGGNAASVDISLLPGNVTIVSNLNGLLGGIALWNGGPSPS